MLARIKALFQPDLADESPSEDTLRLACATLMIEVATIDNDFDHSEESALHLLLKTQFNLNDDESKALSELASQARHSATSLHEFTSEINKHYSPEQKFQLIKSMWTVAYADGHLDKYEEHIIRRSAELIYVSHSDFIRAKLSVKN